MNAGQCTTGPGHSKLSRFIHSNIFPSHYFKGMAWDAALKMTGIKLDLLSEEEMYTFFERSIRGGVSQISKRYAKANNKKCSNFDPLKPITSLIYLDANNLYGWAMSQILPTGDFRWLTSEEIQNLDIANLLDDADNGFVLEVSQILMFR